MVHPTSGPPGSTPAGAPAPPDTPPGHSRHGLATAVGLPNQIKAIAQKRIPIRAYPRRLDAHQHVPRANFRHRNGLLLERAARLDQSHRFHHRPRNCEQPATRGQAQDGLAERAATLAMVGSSAKVSPSFRNSGSRPFPSIGMLRNPRHNSWTSCAVSEVFPTCPDRRSQPPATRGPGTVSGEAADPAPASSWS